MTIRDHILSFAGGAGSVAVAAGTGAAMFGIALATAGVGGVAGLAAVAGIVLVGVAGFNVIEYAGDGNFGAAELKPKSFLAGIFTGLAAAGGWIYAMQADPAEAAAGTDTPAHVVALEDQGTSLAAAFEGADGRRIELRVTKGPDAPGAPAYASLAPAA